MRRNRAPDQLKPLLDRRLTVYTLAAAACLGSATTTANAAVVYTSARQFAEAELGRVASIPIDLNHDGLVDFTIAGVLQTAFSTLFVLQTAFVYAGCRSGGQAAASGSIFGVSEAEALRFGQGIGQPLKFVAPNRLVLAAILAVDGDPETRSGNFYNQTNRFLALKFSQSGHSYYGWARVNVKAVANNKLVFELVDYAYQDTPNKPILAGEGIPQADAALPATLGLLAYGSDAIPAWRR